jgi:hypothetical protein
MEELLQLIVNNGLGIASFFALLYFMNNYITKINETIQKICNTLESVDKNLVDLSNRVERLERLEKEDSNDNT